MPLTAFAESTYPRFIRNIATLPTTFCQNVIPNVALESSPNV